MKEYNIKIIKFILCMYLTITLSVCTHRVSLLTIIQKWKPTKKIKKK